jgi:hypothetical protein
MTTTLTPVADDRLGALNATLPDDDHVERVAAALRQRGFTVLRARTGDEARTLVLDLLPDGAHVHQGSSLTLELTGITAALEASGRFELVRPRLRRMDRATEADRIRIENAAPEVMLGSVHAVTDAGSLLAASYTGSQLPAYAAGAGRVILVVGTQKIVADLEAGLRRIEEHALPLEDSRAWNTYGTHSGLSKVLIINREIVPGRVTVVLVDEALGF